MSDGTGRGPLAAIMAVAMALAVGACGASSSGAEGTARLALERVVAGDGPGVCEYFSEARLAEVRESDGTLEGCRRSEVEHAAYAGARDARVEIDSSDELDGGRVEVRARVVADAADEPVRVELVQEAGGWRVASIEFASFESAVESARAKTVARIAQTTIERAAADGTPYGELDAARLRALEPQLEGESFALRSGRRGYRIAVKAGTGAVFAITRRPAGGTELVCTPPGEGGCPESAEWGS